MIPPTWFFLKSVFFFFFFKTHFYWSILALQCCISFRSTGKWFCFIYIHTHTHTHIWYVCMMLSDSVVLDSATPWCVAHRTPLSMGILQARILEWVCHTLFQGIFPTQRSNPCLPQCRQILYFLGHQGRPRILEWVAYPFSRGTSQPKNRTRSPVLQTFSTSWATRKAIYMYVYISFFRFFSL